jgi:hypothetical protein
VAAVADATWEAAPVVGRLDGLDFVLSSGWEDRRMVKAWRRCACSGSNGGMRRKR